MCPSDSEGDWTLVSQPSSSKSSSVSQLNGDDDLSTANSEHTITDTDPKVPVEPMAGPSKDDGGLIEVNLNEVNKKKANNTGVKQNIPINSTKSKVPSGPMSARKPDPTNYHIHDMQFVRVVEPNSSISWNRSIFNQPTAPQVKTRCRPLPKSVPIHKPAPASKIAPQPAPKPEGNRQDAQPIQGKTLLDTILLVSFGLVLLSISLLSISIQFRLYPIADQEANIEPTLTRVVAQKSMVNHEVDRATMMTRDVDQKSTATQELINQDLEAQRKNDEEPKISPVNEEPKPTSERIDSQVSNDVDFSQHAYPELKLLDEELSDCIRRYETDFKRQEESLKADGSQNSSNRRLFKGIVCYDHEMEWRKRIDRLKSEHQLDIQKLLRQARRKLTSNLLEEYHPSLSFKLIVNQLDYFDYLDNKRRDRALERLKTENLELRQRLSEKFRKDGGKIENQVSSIESENSRLKAEIEALKLSLAEKAGTVYIKQSMELEKSERENAALKKFYNQVAQEVSKGLKQLNLHTIDAAAILDDHESLNSQLALTRGYLLRYVEEVGNLVTRNKVLMDELHEVQAVAARQIEGNAEYQEELDETDMSTTNLNAQNDNAPDSNTSANGDCSNNNQSHTDRSNWLMRRAKLRERLRKASIDHIMGQARDYNKKLDKQDVTMASSSPVNHKQQAKRPNTSSGKHHSHGHKHGNKEHNYYHNNGNRADYNKFKREEL